MRSTRREQIDASHSGWPALLGGLALVSIVWLASPVYAQREITLAQRPFVETSPAAPFQAFFVDARRRAAATTVAWDDTEDDLAAWGPALVFPQLGSGVAPETALALAAPLEADSPAAVLLFRTLGLYAAKSRVAFTKTPTLLAAVSRNLRAMERATHDFERFATGPEVAGWGSVGVGAWLAYLELLYRDYGALEDPNAAQWNANGVRIVDQLLVRGRLAENRGFRRDPRDVELTLWPNALMLYALMKAYENEESVEYETAALDAVAAIDVLRDRDGSYYSTMKRNDKDARANAYLAGAFLLLFKNTGEPRFRDAALSILRWLTGPQRPAGVSVSQDVQVAYLVLLLDSLTTGSADPVLGRRPMRDGSDATGPSADAARQMAERLRPPGFRYRAMLDGVLATLVGRTPFAEGHFAYDYGDSPGYATEVLLRGGDSQVARQIVDRQERLLKWPRPRSFDELSFGAFALLAVDHPDRTAGGDAASALRRYLLLSGVLATADRGYCDWLDWLTGGGGFEYGPTVICAQLAMPQLQYARQFPGTNVGWLMSPRDVGLALLEGVDREAWDATRHVYRTRPEAQSVALLPNAMMILALLDAHQLDQHTGFLARAEEVAGGLNPLWDELRGAYVATYDLSGDKAYQSLSTNSYAAMAFLRLSSATGTARYRERALRIFDFIQRDLYADGIAYHHLYRGRRATGDIWCSGCNWRVVHSLVALANEEQAPSR